MKLGVPKEVKVEEYRVGLVPTGVRALTADGHQVMVQAGAGLGAGVSDDEYLAAGARLVSREEAWAADMVIKVKEPIESEYGFFRPGLLLFTYLHLAAEPALTKSLIDNQVTAVAYETIEDARGELPLLRPMSEVAGRMSIQVGAHYLEKTYGGSGVMLSGLPGVQRGRVTIVGAGVVGQAALKIAVGMGAEVTVLDVDTAKLTRLDEFYATHINTLHSHPDTVAERVAQSDLVIGAVLIHGAKAPHLVTGEMVKAMRPGSVLVDVAIDQGGCMETIKPTTHADPVFVEHGVIHYGVTNMPGAMARTSTFGLTNATLPYARRLAKLGRAALKTDPGLAKGLNCHQGACTYDRVAEAHNLSYTAPTELDLG